MGPHSYDAGISRTGVFWVARIPEESVEVQLGTGEASLDVTNLLVIDAVTIPNSLDPTHPLDLAPGRIEALHLEWSGVTRSLEFQDPTNRFTGLFLENSASIAVTATTPPGGERHGFTFTSEATTASNFAEVGHDRNGVFFASV